MRFYNRLSLPAKNKQATIGELSPAVSIDLIQRLAEKVVFVLSIIDLILKKFLCCE
jgi:hypothetical protein